jgi:PRTRC genetic system ThiF family protein
MATQPDQHSDPRIILREPKSYTLILVGCGGNGGYLAPFLARIAAQLSQKKPTRLIFCDPDVVEDSNLNRQSYSKQEVGCNKAKVLAQRCSNQCNIGISYSPHPFNPSLVPHPVSESLTLIVGCTDNGVMNGQTGRQAIAQCLDLNCYQGKASKMPWVWWLDLGNHYQQGQILLGSSPTWSFDDCQFIGRIDHLPSPALIHPELLDSPNQDEERLNCMERAQVNQQSAGINPIMAAVAHDLLNRLLITQDLTRWAMYLDMEKGTLRSLTTDIVVPMRDAQLKLLASNSAD